MKRFVVWALLMVMIAGVALARRDGIGNFYINPGDATTQTFSIVNHPDNPNGRPAQSWSLGCYSSAPDTAYFTIYRGGYEADAYRCPCSIGFGVDSDDVDNPEADSIKVVVTGTSAFVWVHTLFDR